MVKNTTTPAGNTQTIAPNTVAPSSTVTTKNGVNTTPGGTVLPKPSVTPSTKGLITDTINSVLPSNNDINAIVGTDANGGVKSSAQAIIDTNAQQLANEKARQPGEFKQLNNNVIADQKRVEQQAKDNASLINDTSKNIGKLTDKTSSRITNEGVAQTDLLAKQQANTLTVQENTQKQLQAQSDYQKIQNENAIVSAKAQVELDKQKSAWVYQKLGLGFSSGIINESQRIASNGLRGILEIKAKMTYQEAMVGVEQAKVLSSIEKVNLDYTGLINKSISNTSDKLDNLDMNTEKRLANTQKNLLLNSQGKDNKIADLLKEYRKEKEKLGEEHIQEINSIQDRGLAMQKEVQNQVAYENNIGKQKINDKLKSGELFNMSIGDLNKLASSAGLTLSDLNSLKLTAISSSVSNIASTMLGKDFIIDTSTRNDINIKVQGLLEGGRSLQDATETATRDVLGQTQKFQDKQDINTLTIRAQKAKLNRMLQYGVGTRIKGTDLKKIQENGKQYFGYWSPYSNKFINTGVEVGQKASFTVDVNSKGEKIITNKLTGETKTAINAEGKKVIPKTKETMKEILAGFQEVIK